ncbi:MAG: GNAT family N-acetyltransferase [Lactobacillales bacterium]|jgi:putative acetyltransferase|nr:GNAT family N-acetyltransferase [Lactobacillales bacterium]
MKIREYRVTDNEGIFQLFYDTVHTVNAKDYTKEQLDVWARKDVDISSWCVPFLTDYAVVMEDENRIVGFGNIMEDENRIVGFGNITDSGYIDRLFTHRKAQGKGVGGRISDCLEQHAWTHGVTKITVYASITARPFFEKRGYSLVRENDVRRGNETLINYLMEKNLAQ